MSNREGFDRIAKLARDLEPMWREVLRLIDQRIDRFAGQIGVTGGKVDGSHIVMAHQDLIGVTDSQHHAPVTLGAGSDAALSLSGQDLTLADVLTPTEHGAVDHTGLTGVPSIVGLLDETAHDALDHTGLTGCGGAITVAEADGTPSVANVTTITVSNGKLTDNGSGSVTLDLSGDAGSPDAATVTYTPTTSTDWDGDADPGNLDDALDQLAERVDDLEAGGGSGATTFLDLTDTPSDYTGQSGKMVRVNATGTGLEFSSSPFDGSLVTGFADYTATLADSGIAVA